MPADNTVQQDVAKVENAAKSVISEVQAKESALTRTKLAWVAGVIGLIVGFIAGKVL